MSTVAFAGPGFILKFGTHGSGVYGTTLGQVQDIKGPEQTASFDDVTNQSSPAAVPGGRSFREWIPTLIDGGVVSFPMVFNPADTSQTAALTSIQTGELVDYELVIGNSGYSLFFAAYYQKFGGNFPYAAASKVDVELKITGAVTGPSAST
jgi:hypothetical protein